MKKSASQELHQRLSTAKGYDTFSDILGSKTGEDDFREIEQAILSRTDRRHQITEARPVEEEDPEEEPILSTPPDRENPEPPELNAPLGPSHPSRMTIPAAVSGHDALTPTPGGGVPLAAF